MKDRRFWLPVIASVVATPVLLLLAIGSAGVGHSEPVLGRILFPFPLLAIKLLGDAFFPLVLLLWVGQYPLYGVVIGLAAKRGRGGPPRFRMI